jgi:hypothetical protein
VEKAKQMEEKIDVELNELQATLANIEQARPFEELTVRAFTLLFHFSTRFEVVETMVKKGKWTVPGAFHIISAIGILSTLFRLQGEIRGPQSHVVSCLENKFMAPSQHVQQLT